jgi:hypothetical protein
MEISGFEPKIMTCNVIVLPIRLYSLIFYKILTCVRTLNNLTDLGNINLVNIYIIKMIKEKLYTTWFTKKKGINCGICYKFIIKT